VLRPTTEQRPVWCTIREKLGLGRELRGTAKEPEVVTGIATSCPKNGHYSPEKLIPARC
jgi:hypothetical protein